MPYFVAIFLKNTLKIIVKWFRIIIRWYEVVDLCHEVEDF